MKSLTVCKNNVKNCTSKGPPRLRPVDDITLKPGEPRLEFYGAAPS